MTRIDRIAQSLYGKPYMELNDRQAKTVWEAMDDSEPR